MRAQRPVTEAHLAEAVRRGALSVEQMETLLALARSDDAPAGGHLADSRWPAVVTGLAAAVAVVVPGVTLLAQSRAHTPLALLGACVAGAVACAVVARITPARGWGRVTSAIVTAGVAPYAGGAAMYLGECLVDGVFSRAIDRGYVPGSLDDAPPMVAAVVAALVGVALWRRWRSGPALAVSGFFVPFLATAAYHHFYPSPSTYEWLSFVLPALLSLAAAWWRGAWGRRDAVDGIFWWELGSLTVAALPLVDFYRGNNPWLALGAAVAVGLSGLWRHRGLPQLAGALGGGWMLWVILRGEEPTTRGGALVLAALLIAALAQWQRRREARRSLAGHAPEPLAYWA